MARGGDVLHHRRRARAADQQADVAPRFRFVETIQRVAGGDARLAAGAAIEIDLEGVLLARPRRRRGQERLIARSAERARLRVVPSAELSTAVVPAAEFDRRPRATAARSRSRARSTSSQLETTAARDRVAVRQTIGSDDRDRASDRLTR